MFTVSSPGPVSIRSRRRWIKFTSVREIAEMKSVLKAYIREAIEVEKSGLKLKLRKTSDLKFPEELQTMLDEFPDFRTAFDAFTPGRQRAYIFHFSAPKQSKTREARVRNICRIFSRARAFLISRFARRLTRGGPIDSIRSAPFTTNNLRIVHCKLRIQGLTLSILPWWLVRRRLFNVIDDESANRRACGYEF